MVEAGGTVAGIFVVTVVKDDVVDISDDIDDFDVDAVKVVVIDTTEVWVAVVEEGDIMAFADIDEVLEFADTPNFIDVVGVLEVVDDVVTGLVDAIEVFDNDVVVDVGIVIVDIGPFWIDVSTEMMFVPGVVRDLVVAISGDMIIPDLVKDLVVVISSDTLKVRFETLLSKIVWLKIVPRRQKKLCYNEKIIYRYP